jgi:hypothetical protein
LPHPFCKPLLHTINQCESLQPPPSSTTKVQLLTRWP